MNKLNILCLHQMGVPKYRRQAVVDLEYMFPNYSKNNNYIVHDCTFDLPEYIKELDFHAIILGPTFLCNRYYPKKLKKVFKDFNFIKNSNAYKIALPQDDYDCSAILESWMIDWKIDVIYTVLPNHKNLLYKNYIINNGIVKEGFTGYLSNDLIERWKFPKKHNLRGIDVSYRASKLTANFGEIGYVKSEIANRFINVSKEYNFKLDISIDPKDMIPGKDWYHFMENSKFCLATNSGSSLLDPYGNFRKKVLNHMNEYPDATFSEIKKLYFENEDNKYIMTAISPRNIEACLSETIQICTPGEYSNILLSDEHFVPLAFDCSNIKDVVLKMRDKLYVKKMILSAKENILDKKELYFENHVENMTNLIINNIQVKKINSFSQEKYYDVIKKYNVDITAKLHFYWLKKEVIIKSKEFLSKNEFFKYVNKGLNGSKK